MPQIKVGLIGGGGIATAHIRGYREHAEKIGVTAVADAVEQTAVDRGGELGATPYTDYRRMIEAEDIDAVDICLPHHLHRDAIVAAAQAGKHILCEKPLCLTADEAADVRAAVRANGVTLMCAHNQLFLPAVAKAKELLDAGTIGTVYEVRTTDSFYNDFDPTTMGWRASSTTSGGGELIDTGYHPTYLMFALGRWLTCRGHCDAVHASAEVHGRRGFGAGPDQVRQRRRGPTGDQLGVPVGRRFSVVGELGAMYSDGTTLTYRLRSGETRTFDQEPVDTFVAEIAHFADCLLNRTRPLHTDEEGIAVLGILLAAYEGARTKTIAPVLQP